MQSTVATDGDDAATFTRVPLLTRWCLSDVWLMTD